MLRGSVSVAGGWFDLYDVVECVMPYIKGAKKFNLKMSDFEFGCYRKNRYYFDPYFNPEAEIKPDYDIHALHKVVHKKIMENYLDTFSKAIPANRGYTLDELSKINGAFDKGRKYRCVIPRFKNGDTYVGTGIGVRIESAKGFEKELSYSGGDGVFFVPINFDIDEE